MQCGYLPVEAIKKLACSCNVDAWLFMQCGCLQVIGLLKDAFQKAGLDLYLAPYGVLPTAYECGIIEVVPEASSRSALGETSDAGLYEIFQREFGAPGTESFEIARHNFILSSAG